MIWLAPDEHEYFSGILANVKHYLTVQKAGEQMFYVNSVCPYLLPERPSSL